MEFIFFIFKYICGKLCSQTTNKFQVFCLVILNLEIVNSMAKKKYQLYTIVQNFYQNNLHEKEINLFIISSKFK